MAKRESSQLTQMIGGAMLLGALVLIAAGLAANFLLSRRDTAGPVVHASLNLPPDVTLLTLGDQGGAPAISHDGIATSNFKAGLTIDARPARRRMRGRECSRAFGGIPRDKAPTVARASAIRATRP